MSMFPERLKSLRTDRGISQIKLAKYFNYGSTAIANYESGRNEPSFDVLIKIADYFGVSVDYLLGREDKPMIYRNISLEEEDLLKDFRKLNKELQISISELVKKIKNESV